MENLEFNTLLLQAAMSYIHATARHRRSGSTMQKKKARGALEKFEFARSILPGYPKPDKFTCMEEVEDYLTGEKIVCLLCGKLYRQLAPHTKRIHNLEAADYKEMFGIPQKRGLVGEGKNDAARRYWTSPEARPNIEKMLAATSRSQPDTRRPFAPATKARMTERIAVYGAGETNAAAKLSQEQAREIWRSKEPTKDLCRRFSVTRSTIKRIRRGEAWGPHFFGNVTMRGPSGSLSTKDIQASMSSRVVKNSHRLSSMVARLTSSIGISRVLPSYRMRNTTGSMAARTWPVTKYSPSLAVKNSPVSPVIGTMKGA